ncbi:hypothetical protein [Desulfosporosinus meridiei]|uniref:ASCH domain-containing protein n=1 Tax=Desulfosporosinus meridiei (strain ATCC BAA-275 / DSM 13257 / KCTC 12902 / NCIMB 13706 / S10) TaxID=768704 RepID=J7J1S3_DESMD|nr:hypothetical protein [Desulfosporosinus meridiei]AFQ44901.1 hypothetical protein Desmer_3015 [Desulfosporosinus meridiei DSM 13257]
MLNVLISIKPKYVQEILGGKKKYEYRKSIFKREVDKIYIYSTSPDRKIVGYFKFVGYLKEDPEKIWEITKECSGIDKESFKEYFNNKTHAYAIKIEQLYIFHTPIDPHKVLQNFIAPQSYFYLQGDIVG